MHEEDMRNAVDLCFYRFEKAKQDYRTARKLYEDEDYRAANNRAYYSIFHAMRSVLALDHFDSKKHSGIIAEFRKKYMKNNILPVEISAMIGAAFEIRNASDYDDMFLASKEETKTQIENAEFILSQVRNYIGLPTSSYTALFNDEGNDKDSKELNFILVSLFSRDTLITIYDCDQSERELLKMKWAVEDSELTDEMKDYWRENINKGLDICRRDRNEMEQGS